MGIRFCLVSNEETKMMILLLQSLDLLRHFVSLNSNRPKRKRKKSSRAGNSASKLLSHVIGYDHVVAKGTEGKRHLILLKLMQFLHRDHQDFLYSSHDSQELEHMDQIGICKTFEIKTKGLLQSDLD